VILPLFEVLEQTYCKSGIWSSRRLGKNVVKFNFMDGLGTAKHEHQVLKSSPDLN